MNKLTDKEMESCIRGLEHDNAALERRLDDKRMKIKALIETAEKLKLEIAEYDRHIRYG